MNGFASLRGTSTLGEETSSEVTVDAPLLRKKEI
jgi:hypothetical protein